MAVVPQRPLRGPQRQPDPETPAEDDDAEDDGGDGGEEVCAGYVTVSIVGLQYYAGTVNRDEMVQLIREQQNPYDANAIRVDNVGGERVGHIERYKAWPGLCWPVAAESPAIALHLAPLIDRGEVKIEGLVTSGVTNKYKMPCQVYVHCKAAAADEVVDKLTSAGLPFICEAKGQAYDTTGSQSFQSGNVEKNFESIFKSLAVARGQRQQIEPPSTISSPLFPHQKEALSWLVDREKDRRLPPFWERQECKGETRYLNTITNYSSEDAPQPFRGGILADDMGLGKTLTMLALIATHRPSALLSSVPKKLHDVVSCSTAGSRPNKRQKSDAVVTSTSQVNATDLESMECSTSARATLIVCPLSVVANWAQQIQQHTVESSLSVYEYLGPKRIRDPEELGNYDVVLTTYSTLAVEGDESSTSATLQKVCWFRVILDEAHCIKSPKALQSKAARSLTALHRWAVTGTPIQNKLADLYSLMSFLHLQPLDEQSFWLRTIERPLTYGDPKGYDRLRVLMASIALRRTKSEQVGQPSIELPPRTVQLHLLDLWSCDRQKYEQWEENGRDLIKDMIKHGTVLKNYANVLEVILRLRQICDHASLCPSLDCLAKRVAEQEAAPPELMQKLLEYVRDSGDDDCPICLCPAQPPVITRCAHIYCWRCINKVVTRGNGQCPLCRTAVSSADLIRVPPETRIDGNEATSSELPSEATSSQSQEAMPGSAKIAALAQSLEDVRGADPSIKSVVFSQFTGMLRLVRQVLKASGVRCLTLDGTLSRKQREEVLRVFQSETACSPSVLLVSMKAAGVGINLTAASRVYLLDPWWNPAVEEQAMDRVHRLGQTRPVTVVRFIVRDSIEERILELQERKRHLAAAAFESRTPEDLQRARVDDHLALRVQHVLLLEQHVPQAVQVVRAAPPPPRDASAAPRCPALAQGAREPPGARLLRRHIRAARRSGAAVGQSWGARARAMDVFVLAGQSNMAGRGGVAVQPADGDGGGGGGGGGGRRRTKACDGVVPPECAAPPAAVLRLSAARSWEDAREPLHFDVDKGMPQPHPDPPLRGGPAAIVHAMYNREASEAPVPSLTRRCRSRARRQGESDCGSRELVEGYAVKLERLIAALREDLGSPDLLVFQVGIVTGKLDSTAFLEQLRLSQRKAVVPGLHLVDAWGLELNADDHLHLTTDAQVQLGRSLARAYVDVTHAEPP
eukprot:SM000057S18432  [mRNA]  locus=s57:569771:577747:- [translate_table: standard]